MVREKENLPDHLRSIRKEKDLSTRTHRLKDLF